MTSRNSCAQLATRSPRWEKELKQHSPTIRSDAIVIALEHVHAAIGALELAVVDGQSP
jgi:hypothetical protein